MTNVEKAIEILKRKTTIPNDGESFEDIDEAFNTAIEVLKQDSYYKDLAQSYEKTINKLTKAVADQANVLDKIIAEIKEKFAGYDICEYFEDYDYDENDISEYRSVGSVDDILQIIDKHRK